MDARDLLLASDLSEEKARTFLGRFGFADPARADQSLQRLAELAGDRERLARLVPSLLAQLSVSADPDAALVQLERFFEAVPSALNLVSHLLEDEAAAELLIRVLGASPYLSEILLRNPEYLYWLRASNRIEKTPAAGYFHKETQPAFGFEQAKTGLDFLRRLRRRENLRIAAQDLLGIAPLESIVAQISGLAEAVLEAAFRLLYPEPDGSGFAVLGMGKLGGAELNFSSDIDLLFVHEDGRDPARMVRFARTYTRALAEFSGEGSLYRVDLRLRPMGRSGEIVYPLAAYRQYYETAADTFDRLALIKCRFVAGDPDLGARFVEAVQDFIYRKYLDLAAVEEIRWLKKRTDRKMRRRGETTRNVKLGRGGIREIEFFVQAFQILYGGGNPRLRDPNTLTVLDRLVDAGLVAVSDHRDLRDAYRFFRDLEHRLQLVHDQQTQTLPEDSDELARVARRMGFVSAASSVEALSRELERHTAAVRRIFSSLFANHDQGGVRDLVLNAALEDEAAKTLLRSEGIGAADEALAALRAIQRAPAFPHAPTRMRNLLANLLPALLEQCRVTAAPGAFLNRFDRFCETVRARAELYLGLLESPGFAERLFRVFLSGDFLSETLIRHPELLDSVSRPPAAPPTRERLQETLGEEPNDTAFANRLRLFKRREEFKIALRDLDGFADPDTRRDLTTLAEICLEAVCSRLLPRFDDLRETSFSLCALGKLGGRELTYHSDLDLVLFYRDDPPADAVRFNELAREIKRAMEEYTEAGRLYPVDFRLRPEGRHSGLATPLSAFRSYLGGRIEAWERLAYVKLRPVFGHGVPLDVVPLLPSRPFTEDEIAGLDRLRARKELEIGREGLSEDFDLKVGRGGLMDVQFVVQKLQIDSAVGEVETRRALDAPEIRGALGPASASVLRDGLNFLFRLESAVRLLAERPTNSLPRDPGKIRLLTHFLGGGDAEALLGRYCRITDRNRGIYRTQF